MKEKLAFFKEFKEFCENFEEGAAPKSPLIYRQTGPVMRMNNISATDVYHVNEFFHWGIIESLDSIKRLHNPSLQVEKVHTKILYGDPYPKNNPIIRKHIIFSAKMKEENKDELIKIIRPVIQDNVDSLSYFEVEIRFRINIDLK